MLPHPSLNARTLYALDSIGPHSNHTKRTNVLLESTSAGGSQALRSCSQALRARFVWVKILHSWHSSAGSKTLWISHPTMVIHSNYLSNHPFLPIRLLIPPQLSNQQRKYLYHPDGFSSSQSEAYSTPT